MASNHRLLINIPGDLPPVAVDEGRIGEVLTNLVENAVKVGAYIMGKLDELAAKYSKYISNIRGKGLLIAFDMADSKTRDLIVSKLFEEEVIALSCGHVTIRLRPLLTVDTAAVDILMEKLDKVLASM